MYCSSHQGRILPEFHQANPHRNCRYNRYGHRDARCSLACRCNWARYGSACILKTLRSLPPDNHIYAGTLVSLADLTATDHLRLRTAFLDSMNHWAKDNEVKLKVHAVGDIGDNLRVHYHSIMYSDKPITHSAVKGWWASACGGRCCVTHGVPDNLDAVVKYMMKDLVKVREGKQFIRLFKPGAISQEWGSRGFYGQGGKLARWNECKDDWFGKNRCMKEWSQVGCSQKGVDAGFFNDEVNINE